MRKSGFTIVELLIVIVVIGILAAITIVAYNGVQQRATNQQTTVAVRSYYTAIKTYAIDNGTYPAGNACLGTAEFYTSNPCYIGNSTYIHSPSLNTALSTYIKTPPTLPNIKIEGSITGSGIFYYSAGSWIGFPIVGTSSCPTIAGASEYSRTTIGSDVYCRINFPSL